MPEKNNNTQSLFDPITDKIEIMIFVNTIKWRIFLEVVIMMMKRGEIFCHVKNIAFVQLVSLATNSAPQKCNGANLAFRSRPRTTQCVRALLVSINIPLLSTNSVPTLCTTKYSIMVFLIVQFRERKVINDIRLISNINHMVGQCSVEILPIVPRITPVHIKGHQFLSYYMTHLKNQLEANLARAGLNSNHVELNKANSLYKAIFYIRPYSLVQHRGHTLL